MSFTPHPTPRRSWRIPNRQGLHIVIVLLVVWALVMTISFFQIQRNLKIIMKAQNEIDVAQNESIILLGSGYRILMLHQAEIGETLILKGERHGAGPGDEISARAKRLALVR